MPSLSVCLLLDDAAARAVRRLWRQLAEDGVPSLATYTHGRHVPHLTLASLGPCDVEAVLVGTDDETDPADPTDPADSTDPTDPGA